MKWTSVFILFILVACGVSKEATLEEENVVENTTEPELTWTTPDSVNVKIKILSFIPYCGGMAPTQEMLDNRVHPANGTYLLVNLNSGKSEKVKTDNNGTLHLSLSSGKYGIKELYKDVPFEEFYETYRSDTSNQFMMDGDKNCYKDWWSSYLTGFEISNPDTLIELNSTISSRCFTGNNPCQDYTGPYPP